MQINQFHSGTAVGDAITNQMLALKKLLISKGYESEIYAEYIDDCYILHTSDLKIEKGFTYLPVYMTGLL